MGPTWAVVVAGGEGRRFGRPKQFELLGERTVLDWSIGAARSVAVGVVVVVPLARVDEVRRTYGVEAVVAGGETRAESVRAGLVAVPEPAAIIVVHDAARPLASVELFASVVGAVRAGADGAVPGVALTDTVKRVRDGVVVETLDRSVLVGAQTPQAFRASSLRAAHASSADATDDAALVEALGGHVVVVPGDLANVKLTSLDDLVVARRVAGIAEAAT